MRLVKRLWQQLPVEREQRHADRRQQPEDRRPAGVDEEEAADLFRGLVSYGGRWEVKGDEVFHSVDISANEIWTGTEQQRFYRFDGDRLSLSTPVNPDPIDGKMSVRSMLWERVK